jgi:hypothetical protein
MTLKGDFERFVTLDADQILPAFFSFKGKPVELYSPRRFERVRALTGQLNSASSFRYNRCSVSTVHPNDE